MVLLITPTITAPLPPLRLCSYFWPASAVVGRASRSDSWCARKPSKGLPCVCLWGSRGLGARSRGTGRTAGLGEGSAPRTCAAVDGLALGALAPSWTPS